MTAKGLKTYGGTVDGGGRVRWMLLAWLGGCAGEPEPVVEAWPPRPADLVFVRLGGGGNGDWVYADSMLREAELFIDSDTFPGQEFPFQYDLLDASGEVLFHGSRREPVQIREFLAAQNLGTDPFLSLPKLGDLAVMIPRDPDAVTLQFWLKTGTETKDLGSFSLEGIPDAEPYPATAEKISGTASPEQAFDVVIVGDGYTEAEMPLFAEHAAVVAESFAMTPPFSEFADRVNVWRVDAVSNESGAAYDCSSQEELPNCRDGWRETAFGSVFPLRAIGLLTGQELWDVVLFQLEQWEVFRAAATAPYDHVIVLVNTPKYGAFGMYATSIYTGEAEDPSDGFAWGTLHEFGHAFGLLADEYSGEASPCQQYPVTPDFPNMAAYADSAREVPWGAWVEEGIPIPTPNQAEWDETIGLFRGVGGGCTDLYRPARRCKMYSWTKPYCEVCTEQLVKRLYQQFDAVGTEDLEVADGWLTPRLPEDGTFVAEWWMDGILVGDGLKPMPALPGKVIDWVVTPVVGDVRRTPEDLAETIRVTVPEAYSAGSPS